MNTSMEKSHEEESRMSFWSQNSPYTPNFERLSFPHFNQIPNHGGSSYPNSSCPGNVHSSSMYPVPPLLSNFSPPSYGCNQNNEMYHTYDGFSPIFTSSLNQGLPSSTHPSIPGNSSFAAASSLKNYNPESSDENIVSTTNNFTISNSVTGSENYRKNNSYNDYICNYKSQISANPGYFSHISTSSLYQGLPSSTYPSIPGNSSFAAASSLKNYNAQSSDENIVSTTNNLINLTISDSVTASKNFRKNNSRVQKQKLAQDVKPRKCSNCETIKTPLWRRKKDDKEIVCNACGLYWKTRNEVRPRSMRKDSIQHRRKKIIRGSLKIGIKTNIELF